MTVEVPAAPAQVEPMSLIGIRFHEFRPGTYEYTYVHPKEPGEIVKFASAELGEDFKAALAFAGEPVSFLSSVDNFITDDPDASAAVRALRHA